MISRIKKIDQAGIFQNHKPDDAVDFRRYNLLYGWNGSGKTTLARLFRNLETPRKSAPNINGLKYSVMFDEIEITDTTSVIPENVMVFNSDFVRDNLSLEQAGANSILYVGDKNVELVDQLKVAKEKQTKVGQEYSSTGQQLLEASKKHSLFFTDLGRKLAEFHSTTVFANESRSLDKRKVEEIWSELKSGDALTDFLLDEEDYGIMVKAIQQNAIRKRLNHYEYIFDEDFFKEGYKRLQELLETSLMRESIKRLDSNPDIEYWVNYGRELHHQHASNKCEYCQQVIPSDRIEALDKHFDTSFNELQNNLRKFLEELQGRYIKEPSYNIDEVLVEEKENFARFYDEVFRAVQNINQGIDNWINLLNHKLENPNNRGYSTSNIISGILVTSSNALNRTIKWQNEYIDNAVDIAKDYRVKLDRYIVANDAISRELSRIEHEIAILGKRKDELYTGVEEHKTLVKSLEDKLNDDTIVLEEFNDDLHRFIGRSNIMLDSKQEGGYVLLRDNHPALNLSEGEKSAICLVYFIKKLRENENQLANTIVVFDDPVSSFDSNHLFQACSYILTNCRDSKQLFVFTHNFWFFKITRDWMMKQWNKKKSKEDHGTVALYEIRKGELKNAPRSLCNHHSEYQYIFKQVKIWAESDDIDLQENFTLANLCRRLLESFNAFKTATHEGFAQILDLAFKGGVDESSLNKLKYFLHKYSHLDRIEEYENAIENIQAEGKSVAKTTLSIIEVLDPVHFESMMKLAIEKEVA